MWYYRHIYGSDRLKAYTRDTLVLHREHYLVLQANKISICDSKTLKMQTTQTFENFSSDSKHRMILEKLHINGDFRYQFPSNTTRIPATTGIYLMLHARLAKRGLKVIQFSSSQYTATTLFAPTLVPHCTSHC